SWRVRGDGLNTDLSPAYTVEFTIPLGDVGGLVSDGSILSATLHLGWTPGGADDKKDTAGAVLTLPASISGPNGFQIQGVVKTTFEYVQLEQMSLVPSKGDATITIYLLRFVHTQGYMLNMPLLYNKGPKDLTMFGGPP